MQSAQVNHFLLVAQRLELEFTIVVQALPLLKYQVADQLNFLLKKFSSVLKCVVDVETVTKPVNRLLVYGFVRLVEHPVWQKRRMMFRSIALINLNLFFYLLPIDSIVSLQVTTVLPSSAL